MRHLKRETEPSDSQSAALGALADAIRSGRLAPEQKLPSERQIAADYGMERREARNVIDQLVKAGFAHRRPNCMPTVSTEWQTHAREIVVRIPSAPSDPGFTSMCEGAVAVLTPTRFKVRPSVVLGNTWEENCADEDRFFLDLASDPAVAGAIICPLDPAVTTATFARLIASGKSIVLVDREVPGPRGLDLVATNNFGSARSGTRFLLSEGHQHIVFVTNGEDVSSVHDRVAGFAAAIAEAGPGAARSRIVHPPDAFLLRCIGSVVDEIIAEAPTAVFATNDYLAQLLYDEFVRRGIRIPEQLSLLGFDWELRWLPSGGHISSMAQQFDEIGRLAATRLLHILSTAGTSTPTHLLLEAPYVDRGSVGEPRVGPLLGRK